MAGIVHWIDRRLYELDRRRLVFIRLGVILGLLAVSAGIGLVFSGYIGFLFLGLAGAIGMVGLLVLYRLSRFEYGILAIVITAGLFNFFTLPTGSESRVVLSLVIAIIMIGVWILQMIFPSSETRLKPSAINAPIFAFIIINFVSYVWSNMLRDPLVIVWDSFPLVQLAALAVNILLPLLALMVANKIEDSRWLKIIAWITMGVGALALASNVFSLSLNHLYSNGTRGVFIVWTGIMAYSIALFERRLPIWLRASLLALTLGWVWYTFVQHTFFLSGWMPLLFAIPIVSFLRSKRLFLLITILVLLLGALNYNRLYEQIVVSNQKEGSAQRLDLWRTNLGLVARHPLFGTGPAGYAVYYMTYNPQDARSTHNNYFDILAQTGVVGSLAFIWMAAAFGLVGFRVWRRARGGRNFEEAYAAGAFAGLGGALLAMMLGDWVLPFAYNQTITGFDNASFTWIFLGGMVSLDHIFRSRRGAEQEG